MTSTLLVYSPTNNIIRMFDCELEIHKMKSQLRLITTSEDKILPNFAKDLKFKYD